MTNRAKYITATVIIFFALIIAVSKNYYAILYAIDSARDFYYTRFISVEYAGISLELRNRLPMMKKTFQGLPAGFSRCGPFFIFSAYKDTLLDDVLAEAVIYTKEYKINRLKQAVIKYNGLGKNEKSMSIEKGTSILIPHALPVAMPSAVNSNLPELIGARGLYMTGTSASSTALLEKLPYLKKSGFNTIVFDVKDVDGALSYRSRVSEAVKYGLHEKAPIDNPDMFIRTLKAGGIYTVARIAVFRDMLLIKKNPELAVKSKRTGGIWSGGGERWCDPTNLTVQDYNLALAMEAISKGVDEIQFDYIRFPTGGDLNDASFSYQCGKTVKEEVISDFLKRAYEKISAANARLSIDVFGVVAWGKSADIKSTGQRIELLARYCDYISPMLYPSHFNDNFDGFKNPADNPEHFISTGNRKVLELLPNKNVVIRPWLQAFKWKVSGYGPEYIIRQIRASDSSGGRGYLFWNSSNDYRHVLAAMESIFAAGEKR